MAITHVVFDIDGTMVDTEAAVQLALQETMEQLLGQTPSLGELHYTFSMPTDSVLRVLGFPDIPAAHRLWKQKCLEKLGRVCIFDGIPQLLEALLRKGYVLGIVSSETRREYQLVFLPLGLGDCFGTVVLAEDTREQKPHPAPLLRYMERTGAKPGEVLYVGDSLGDMLCAQEAGARGALACWCGVPAEGDVPYRLERPGQLLDLLDLLEEEEQKLPPF